MIKKTFKDITFTSFDSEELQKMLGLDESGKVTIYLAKQCADNVKDYVSYKSGTQMAKVSSKNNVVTIGVAYAEYQAYSTKIKKRVGKRGTQPWERMINDKGSTILNEVATYSKKENK